MTESVIIRRCATLCEAQICNGFLQSRGILSSIDNAHHAAVDWSIVSAIGGVHIRVPISQYEDSKTLIIDRVIWARETLEKSEFGYEPITKTRYGRAASMLIIWLGLFNLAAGAALAMIDTYIPASWFPAERETDLFFTMGLGIATPSPSDQVDGFVFLFIVFLFLVWELVSTRETKPQKEPQI